MIDTAHWRSWGAVHATRPAAAAQVVTLIVALVAGSAAVERMGFIQFVRPISVLLLLPVIAGSGAALASVRTFDLPLPDPLVARASRVGWALAWLAVAIAATGSSQLIGAETAADAVLRNTLLHGALGVTMVRVAQGRFVWVPSVTITLLAMLFGHPEVGTGYHWWAVFLEERTTIGEVLVAGGIYLLSLGNLVRPHRT